MPKSQRVPVSTNLSNGKTFEQMRANVRILTDLDTPQALPVLDFINAQTPGPISVLFRFGFNTAINSALGFGVVILALIEFVVMLVAVNALGRLPGFPAILIWFGLWLGWSGLVLVMDVQARTHLDWKTYDLQPKAPPVVVWALWIPRAMSWLLNLGILIGGIAGALPLFLFALITVPEMFISLLPMSVPNWVIPLAQFCAIGLITVLMVRRRLWLVFFPLWFIGAVGLVFQNRFLLLAWLQQPSSFPAMQLTPMLIMVLTLAMSLVHPFRFTTALAGISRGLFTGWQSEVERVYLVWLLQQSLQNAFAQHNQRNYTRVSGNGARAICRTDLEFFQKQKAGPISFWWCPTCNDDHVTYTNIRAVQGVLDKRMNAKIEQQDSCLRVNLLGWRQNSHRPPPLPLHELYVGQVDDPHEVEWFIMQYRIEQPKQKNWVPLKTIQPVLAQDSNIDEHTWRQISHQLSG